MKKTVSRLLALALTAALVLTGCGGGGASEGENGSTGSSAEAAEGEITDLYIPRLTPATTLGQQRARKPPKVKLLKATNLVKMKSLTWLFQRH